MSHAKPLPIDAFGGARVLVILLALSLIEQAGAAPYVFTISPVSSWLGIAGDAEIPGLFGPYPIQPQGLGTNGPSVFTSLSGSLNAETDLHTTIQFTGGSSIAPNNSGEWSPATGGLSGTQPAEFGAKFGISGIATTIEFTMTNSEFDLTSAAIPISAAQFDSSQLELTLATSTIDYRGVISGIGTEVLTDITEFNITGPAHLTVFPNVAILSIPIEASADLVFDFVAYHATFIGQIHASASVPEVGSAKFALIAGVAIFLLVIRQGIRRL